YVVMYVAYRMIDSEEKLELALLFFIVGAAYIGYEAMNVGRDTFGRVEGIGTVDSPNANTIAASIVPVIPLFAYFGWLGRMRIKIFIAVAAAFVVNGLVLINSRGAFLGAVVGFAYFVTAMVFSKYKMPKQRLFIVLIVLASLALTVRLIDNTFIDRMATIETQSSAESEGSGGRRINFWMATFDLAQDYPFGAGIYGYETLSPIYVAPEFLGTEYGRSARAVHSIWFQALSEIGWLGLSAFLILLVSLYMHSRKTKKLLLRRSKIRQYYLLIALEGGMIGFLISSSFINMFRSQVLYWMLLFGISACVILARNYGEKEVSGTEAASTGNGAKEP
ncbi:MAG: O-antigen ligase domain-containing protein, partial [Rhodothermales bacterium]|nr:O-antigen ligase domain-containing protein [Rhodothermales bacterium]